MVEITEKTELSETILELLNKRGITDESEIEEFLSDKPKKTYDPALLSDIEAGVDLILAEIKRGAKICIYGDYDADGITSTALMMSMLKHLMPPERLDYYIPSRFEEGYGLNTEAVKHIAERGFDMIITVDCGSVSAAEVEYAQSLGMTVLVTDHHNITDTMAGCLLINPKRPGSSYPFKELSGCGVAFKVAQMLQKKAGLPKSVLSQVLDLVAIGTVGDIMPLIDENRTMVKFGLQIINMGRRAGLKSLIEGAGLKVGNITSENIGFVIVPHLNASGRIEDASQAVKLMMAEAGDPCINEIVEDLLFKNQERKRLQNETYKSCISILEKRDPEDFILIESEDAHEGIAGIVAGKIKDTFYRPSVILTPSGDKGCTLKGTGRSIEGCTLKGTGRSIEGCMLKGTGRSIEGVNLYMLLKRHEDLFEKFGGHAGACGFTMKADNFKPLHDGLIADMEELYAENPDIFVKKYPIDMELTAGRITVDFAEQLQMLAPFGNGNPKPLFRLTDVRICDVRYMGTENRHVRFTATENRQVRFSATDMTDRPGSKAAASRSVTSIQCVLFNKAEQYKDVLWGNEPVDIIGSIDCQVWQGVKRLQFMVEKIQLAG